MLFDSVASPLLYVANGQLSGVAPFTLAGKTSTNVQIVYYDRSLKLTRNADGVLIAQFNTGGGPLTFKAQDHTDIVDAFYRIAQDRANKIVILTGTGGDFIRAIDFASFGDVGDADVGARYKMKAFRL